MPAITGFGKLASVTEERITDKIRRRASYLASKGQWFTGK